MMLAARTLLSIGDTSRSLYLFDTYEGHPKPDSYHDVDLWGNFAVREWEKHRKTDETSDWGYVSIEEVRANLETTGYPMDKVVLVKGMVEKTLSARVPTSLSLARLDTDWYASAKAGLEACWPRLQRGGILIVDDYGHYRGQRKAVDEYFAASPVMLHRVDYSCRTIVKTS
jgi:O-methyltransferase